MQNYLRSGNILPDANLILLQTFPRIYMVITFIHETHLYMKQMLAYMYFKQHMGL